MQHLVLFALFVIQCLSQRNYTYTVTPVGTTAWALMGSLISGSQQNPTINVGVGDSITFVVAASSFHPFSVHTVSGGGMGPVNDPNTYAGFNSGVSGQGYANVPSTVRVNILAQSAGTTLYYVCQNHPAMTGQIKVAPVSLCAKYAAALNLSQKDLMYAAVNAIVKNEVANPQMLQYFNGSKPAGSTNFLAGTPAANVRLNKLVFGLVNFFGGALGCTDPAVSSYGANNMTAVHQGRGISVADTNVFNQIFISTLGSLGVTSADQAAILGVLQSFTPQITATAPAPAPTPTPAPRPPTPTPAPRPSSAATATFSLVLLATSLVTLMSQ